MSKKRRQYSPDDKFKVALEATKSAKTLAEIANASGVHPNHVSQLLLVRSTLQAKRAK